MIKVGDRLKSSIKFRVANFPKNKNHYHRAIDKLEVAKKENPYILCEGSDINRCQFAINYAHKYRTGKRFSGRMIGHEKKRFWRKA